LILGLEVCRELAGMNADALGPDLAQSLATLGPGYRSQERWAAGVRSFREALLTQIPFLMATPQAFAHHLVARDRGPMCGTLAPEPMFFQKRQWV
jgi:hypothetical protein